MTSAKQMEANKNNALVSTGPRTPEGNAIVARNAVKHGLTGATPVVAGQEREEDWQDFRDGVIADLAPQGSFEEALAERIALSFWRLQRVARYETGVINVDQEEIEGLLTGLRNELKEAIGNRKLALGRVESSKQKIAFMKSLATRADDEKIADADVYEVFDAAPAPDDEFAKAMGLPPVAHKNPWNWDGWTVGLFRQIMGRLAAKVRQTPDDLLAQCVSFETSLEEQKRGWGAANEEKAEGLSRRIRETDSRLRRKRILPDEETLAKIARYEGHFGKQLSQAIHELQRIQELRRGGYVPPPMVVDVTINGAADAVG